MDVAIAQHLALSLVKTYLPDWRFSWDGAYRRFGACVFHEKRITLSWRLTVANDESEVRDTILHEIAHALVGRGHDHDWHWKAMAQRIGAKPKARCGANVKSAKAPWQGICPNCDFVHKMYKAPRAVHFCVKCKPAPIEVRVIHWKRVA